MFLLKAEGRFFVLHSISQLTINKNSKKKYGKLHGADHRIGLVRIRGLEPPPSCLDQNLNLARLPIPPYPHIHNGIHFTI